MYMIPVSNLNTSQKASRYEKFFFSELSYCIIIQTYTYSLYILYTNACNTYTDLHKWHGFAQLQRVCSFNTTVTIEKQKISLVP